MVYKVGDYNQVLYCEELLNNEKFDLFLNAKLIINQGLPLTLKLYNENIEITKENDIITEIANKPLNISRIKEQLAKTDSKLIKLKEIDVEYDGISFISISNINQIRRDALKIWIDKYLDEYEIDTNNPFNLNKIKKKNLYISDKFDFVVHTKEQYDWCKANGFNNIYSYFDHTYERHLHFYQCDGKKMIHNFGDYDKQNVLSPSCNIVNKEHLKLLNHYNIETAYLSHELSLTQILDLIDLNLNYNLGIFVYGKPEVMVSRHCFINKIRNMKNVNCGLCLKNNYKIQDMYGNNMLVYANCYDNVPELSIHHYKKINNFKYIKEVRHRIMKYLVILTDESIEELNKIKNKIRQEGD